MKPKMKSQQKIENALSDAQSFLKTTDFSETNKEIMKERIYTLKWVLGKFDNKSKNVICPNCKMEANGKNKEKDGIVFECGSTLVMVGKEKGTLRQSGMCAITGDGFEVEN